MISEQSTGVLGKCYQLKRTAAIKEYFDLVEKWNKTQTENNGSHALYTIVGQKADFMMMLLRPTMEELNEIETEFNKTKQSSPTLQNHPGPFVRIRRGTKQLYGQRL